MQAVTIAAVGNVSVWNFGEVLTPNTVRHAP